MLLAMRSFWSVVVILAPPFAVACAERTGLEVRGVTGGHGRVTADAGAEKDWQPGSDEVARCAMYSSEPACGCAGCAGCFRSGPACSRFTCEPIGRCRSLTD